MNATHNAPKGADFEVNWALQLLRERGDMIGETYAIDAPTGKCQSSSGAPPVERIVNDVWMTDEQVIRQAEQYPEWQGRKGLFLEYKNYPS